MSIQEKVLIVEDEENERTGMAELVSAWGYRTETAKDGLEGLEKVATWSPGIVITDLKMPLCCENIFAPLVPRPTNAGDVDRLARRAREFLETVIAGLQ